MVDPHEGVLAGSLKGAHAMSRPGLMSATSRRRPARVEPLAFDRLCVAICHDLRGPVTTAGEAVSGLARSLPASNSEHHRWLEIARRSLARADELLLALPLLLTREAPVRRSVVCLDAILDQVRRDVAPEIELAEARLTVHGALGVACGDPDRLRVALRNLLRNAVQHRRAGVDLTVSIRAWRRADRVVVTIADNGTGLPPHERARLRGRLRPSTGSATGGLGLAIARSAIEACGGQLAATGREGTGTTFALTLAAPPGAEASGAAPPPGKSERSLRRRRPAGAATRP